MQSGCGFNRAGAHLERAGCGSNRAGNMKGVFIMRETTQDETVNEPNDGIHLVVILVIAGIGGWLHVSNWIISGIETAYFAIIFLFVDKKGWRMLVKLAGALLILWFLQKWLFG